MKICIRTSFQLNSIICWHSNIIWMTFLAISWYLTSYLTSQYRLTPSKSQNVIILTPQSVFHPKNTHLYAFWDQHSHLIKIFGVLGDFWFILGHFWVHDVTKQKGSRFLDFKFLTSSSVFSPQITYPCTFLCSNNYFICVLGDLWLKTHEKR